MVEAIRWSLPLPVWGINPISIQIKHEGHLYLKLNIFLTLRYFQMFYRKHVLALSLISELASLQIERMTLIKSIFMYFTTTVNEVIIL